MAMFWVPAKAAIKLPFGLFSVSDIIESDEPHWQTGTIEQPPTCGIPEVYPSCFSADAESPGDIESIDTAKTFNRGVPTVEAYPFTVYATALCSPVGGFWDDAVQRSRDWLMNGAERAVESEIASPIASGGASLTGADTVDVTPTPGTPVSLVEGFALLEQYIGANGSGQGTILAPRRAALAAVSANAIVWPAPGQQTLYTALNTPVAALGGFEGSIGPGGEAAGTGQSWVFAIGSRPTIRRSAMWSVPRDQSLNLTNNDLTALTEQTYVVSWSCFTVGVLIDTAVADDLGAVSVSNFPAAYPGNVTNFPATYPQPSTARTQTITRLTAGADRAIPVGRRSYTVTVVAAASGASPTLDGVALPAGYTATFSAPENDTLAAASVLTVAGDDVIVLEVN